MGDDPYRRLPVRTGWHHRRDHARPWPSLGETIGVYLVISQVFTINIHILHSGTNSISSLIALRYGEANPFETSALMAAGLALFIMTMAINFGASIISGRSRSGATAEA